VDRRAAEEEVGPTYINTCAGLLGSELTLEHLATRASVDFLPEEIPIGGVLLRDANALAEYWSAFGGTDPVPEFDFSANQLLAYATDSGGGRCADGARTCLSGLFESTLEGAMFVVADERDLGCSRGSIYVGYAGLYTIPLGSVAFCSDTVACADTGGWSY
jgi:hypothetical protein